jgi:hypothetical protein
LNGTEINGKDLRGYPIVGSLTDLLCPPEIDTLVTAQRAQRTYLDSTKKKGMLLNSKRTKCTHTTHLADRDPLETVISRYQAPDLHSPDTVLPNDIV